MFYNGMDAGGTERIGIALINNSDPYNPIENPNNPLYGPSYCRVNSVVYDPVADVYNIYYTLQGLPTAVYLMTCPTGSDGYTNLTTANLVQYAGNPTLPNAGTGRTDETSVGEFAVERVDATHWYGYYTYAINSNGLPIGIRLATSSDGKTWTKVTSSDLIAAIAGDFYEHHQVFVVNGVYILAVEHGLNAGGRWTIQLFYSTAPDLSAGQWTPLDPATINQLGWPGYTSSLYNVATPCFVLINGAWYLYYTATSGPVLNYNSSNWALYAVNCTKPVSAGSATLYIPRQNAVSSLLSNLVGYWQFENTNWFDQVQGINMTGFGTPTPTTTTGVIGNAAALISSDTQYLGHANEARIEPAGKDFTWAGWVKLTDKVTTYIASGIHNNLSSSASEWFVGYNSGTDQFFIQVYYGAGSSASVSASTFGSPTAGTWYFIRAWIDHTANTLNISVNNSAANSTAFSSSLNSGQSTSFTFGGSQDGSHAINGTVDEAGLWISSVGGGAVLTTAQAAALYNGGVGATWPFTGVP